MTTVTETGLVVVPPAPPWGMRARVAHRLIEQVVQGAAVRCIFPDGRVVGDGPEDGPAIYLVRPRQFFARMGAQPKVGLGESYMAGDWRVAPGSDLAEVLAPFPPRLATMLPAPLMALRGLVDRAVPSSQRNTVTGSRENIAAHYDLSNDHFAAFLDPTMSYSSALFEPTRPFVEQDFVAAQHRKIDAILDAARVAEGGRVLEIGSGWGELAIRAARRGARVTTITLSVEQQQLARERIAAVGLSDQVEVRLQDYREVTEQFDAVVSVEMIEAVGEEFWPTYIATIDQRLAPGGTAAIQAILMDHQRLLTTKDSFGWIQKYIFPGGLIPSLTAIREVTSQHTSLRITQVNAFGLHYAETLRRWREQFNVNWDQIEGLGFDETFRRMWEFYLAYCEAGFATGYLDVAQITLSRP